MPSIPVPRRALWPAVLTSLLLMACGATSAEREPWSPVWQDAPAWQPDDAPPAFTAPSATHCRRLPSVREVPGGGAVQERRGGWRYEREMTSPRADGALAKRGEAVTAAPAKPMAEDKAVAESRTSADASADAGAGPASPPFAPPPWPQPQPQPSVQRPTNPVVTAGMVDDNADFGEYLAYRQRHAGLPVRDRDISERYLLEVTDANGLPVHDAEVAVQRPGIAQPVMWARTDTAGRVWLHPRAFMPSIAMQGDERTLGVAVRKGSMQSRALLTRGQANAVQVRLGAVAAQPVRLDLVFLIDATGSMGDEIAKLKASMRAMAQQIAQLPGQPDICWGLVSYRDRGDAYLTRTHDFVDDLGAFQQQLAGVQAHGGGDTPEALNEALHEVVHRMSWRQQAARMVVLVADAPPHLDYGGCTEAPDTYGVRPPGGPRAVLGRPGDCPQYDRDMQAALAKGIKLFAVGASGLDPVGEYIYRQMAQYTAGRFVFLTYRDASHPASGPGTQTPHDVTQYSVQTLDRLVVRLVGDELARLKRS